MNKSIETVLFHCIRVFKYSKIDSYNFWNIIVVCFNNFSLDFGKLIYIKKNV
jgi:hypothetical protein